MPTKIGGRARVQLISTTFFNLREAEQCRYIRGSASVVLAGTSRARYSRRSVERTSARCAWNNCATTFSSETVLYVPVRPHIKSKYCAFRVENLFSFLNCM